MNTPWRAGWSGMSTTSRIRPWETCLWLGESNLGATPPPAIAAAATARITVIATARTPARRPALLDIETSSDVVYRGSHVRPTRRGGSLSTAPGRCAGSPAAAYAAGPSPEHPSGL